MGAAVLGPLFMRTCRRAGVHGARSTLTAFLQVGVLLLAGLAGAAAAGRHALPTPQPE